MRRDSRLSTVLHILLHMAELKRPVTSEVMARVVRSNPVVIRRTMAGLRDAGFVRSEKGHGGGWTFACDLESTSLRDVYVALGAPELFAIGDRSETPACLVEDAVNAALASAVQEARALLLDRFAQISLAQLSDDFHARARASGLDFSLDAVHAA